MNKKILVGMSGGVDSAVAALKMQQAGFDVTGAIIEIWDPQDPSECETSPETFRPWSERGCCHVPMVKYLCEEILSIPFVMVDRRDAFRQKVMDPFRDEYLKAQTPNPCVTCNAQVKIHELMALADSLNIQNVATGHYARKVFSPLTGVFHVAKGRDPKKDQAYFLAKLQSSEIERLEWPLADLTKEEVREIARESGFPVSEMVENMEACFVSDKNLKSYLDQWIPLEMKGQWEAISQSGEKIGSMEGGLGLTRGQRRGMGTGFGERVYVLDIHPERKQVVLGSKESLFVQDCILEDWSGPAPDSIQTPLSVVFRSSMKPVPCEISWYSPDLKRVGLSLMEPSPWVSPGQVGAILFDKEVILGAGTISLSENEEY